MQLSGVLHKERIRYQGERRISTAEFRDAAFLGWIVDGCKTSRRPAGGTHEGARELIQEGPRVAGTAWISGRTEHQNRSRRC